MPAVSRSYRLGGIFVQLIIILHVYLVYCNRFDNICTSHFNTIFRMTPTIQCGSDDQSMQISPPSGFCSNLFFQQNRQTSSPASDRHAFSSRTGELFSFIFVSIIWSYTSAQTNILFVLVGIFTLLLLLQF